MKKPVNEMGVVSLFSQYAQGLGFVIMEIQAPFPDATLYEIKTEKIIRAEFEYMGKNFVKHGHDPNQCDMLICWENDWSECPLRVIELCNIHGQEPSETIMDLQRESIRLQGAINKQQDEYASLFRRSQVLKDDIEQRKNTIMTTKSESVLYGDIQQELVSMSRAIARLKPGAYSIELVKPETPGAIWSIEIYQNKLVQKMNFERMIKIQNDVKEDLT